MFNLRELRSKLRRKLDQSEEQACEERREVKRLKGGMEELDGTKEFQRRLKEEVRQKLARAEYELGKTEAWQSRLCKELEGVHVTLHKTLEEEHGVEIPQELFDSLFTIELGVLVIEDGKVRVETMETLGEVSADAVQIRAYDWRI